MCNYYQQEFFIVCVLRFEYDNFLDNLDFLLISLLSICNFLLNLQQYLIDFIASKSQIQPELKSNISNQSNIPA